jgi:hypothetical protein
MADRRVADFIDPGVTCLNWRGYRINSLRSQAFAGSGYSCGQLIISACSFFGVGAVGDGKQQQRLGPRRIGADIKLCRERLRSRSIDGGIGA